MKTMSYRSAHCSRQSPSSSVSPQGRIRKERSEERKEKQKVEATLRRLVGTSEDVDQCEFIHQIMSYIRELQSQLNADQDATVPANLDALFSTFTTSADSEMIADDKENVIVSPIDIHASTPRKAI